MSDSAFCRQVKAVIPIQRKGISIVQCYSPMETTPIRRRRGVFNKQLNTAHERLFNCWHCSHDWVTWMATWSVPTSRTDMWWRNAFLAIICGFLQLLSSHHWWHIVEHRACYKVSWVSTDRRRTIGSRLRSCFVDVHNVQKLLGDSPVGRYLKK